MIALLVSLLQFLAIAIGAPLVLWALARWVGLGRCVRCARNIPPWDGLCEECRS